MFLVRPLVTSCLIMSRHPCVAALPQLFQTDHSSSFNGLEKQGRALECLSQSVPVKKKRQWQFGISTGWCRSRVPLSVFPKNHWTLKTNFPIWQRRENILARKGDIAKTPWSQQKQSYRSGCVHLEFHSLIQFPLSLFARGRLNTAEECSLNRKESARRKGRSLVNTTNWESPSLC